MRIELLGVPRLVFPDAGSYPLIASDAALLALLLLDGPQPRNHVATLLWPESPTEQAQSFLRQRIHRLKKRCGFDLVVSAKALSLCEGVAHDLDPADPASVGERTTSDRPLLGNYEYKDELGDWVTAARQRRSAALRRRLADEAEALESAGRVAEALVAADQLALDDPTAEHAHRRVMRLHYLRGDRAAGLAAFERCRRVLDGALGTPPSRETRDLAALIERSGTLGAPAAAPMPVSILRPPKLIGAAAAWRTLSLGCETSRSVLVEGEAGIGKTRLMGDFIASRPATAAAMCASRAGDASLPYALLGRVVELLAQRFGPPALEQARNELARVSPRLGPAPPTRLDRVRLGASWAAALEGWSRAGLRHLALDDLHYADDASLETLLLSMSGADTAPEASPTLLLGVRSDEMPAPLQNVADALDGRGLLRICLQGLDLDRTRELLESLSIEGLDCAKWTTALHARSGGNPLFLLETLTSLLNPWGSISQRVPPDSMPVPLTVGQLINRRMRRLDRDALLLAQTAALAGSTFELAMAAHVVGRSPLQVAALCADLEAANVLRGERFVHDLAWDATVASTPATVARMLHRAIAEHLSASGAEAATIAVHRRGAEQWQAAGESFMRAASVAERASQRKLEVELAKQAADCFAQANSRTDEFSARERRLRAGARVEPFDHNKRLASALVEMAGSPAERCRALEAQAEVLIHDADDRNIVALANEARTIAASIGDMTHALLAAGHEARALARMAHTQNALKLVADFLPVAQHGASDTAGTTAEAHWRDEADAGFPTTSTERDAGLARLPPAVCARAFADFGCALMTCDHASEADVLFDHALRIAAKIEHWTLAQDVCAHKAWVAQHRGDIAATARHYEAARAYAPRLGAESWPIDVCEAILGRIYGELGRYDEAIALLEALSARQNPQSSAFGTYIIEYALSWVFLELGQPGRAAAALKTVPDAGTAACNRRLHLMAQIRIAMRSQRPTRHLAEAALHAAQLEGGTYPKLIVQAFLSRSLPPTEGASLALDACAESDALDLGAASGPLRLAACEALWRSGQHSPAAEIAVELMQRFSRLAPMGFYAPEYFWIASRALLAAGDEKTAAEAMRRAADWVKTAAARRVPAPFRSSYLNRNPVNKDIVAAVRQTGCPGSPQPE